MVTSVKSLITQTEHHYSVPFQYQTLCALGSFIAAQFFRLTAKLAKLSHQGQSSSFVWTLGLSSGVSRETLLEIEELKIDVRTGKTACIIIFENRGRLVSSEQGSYQLA